MNHPSIRSQLIRWSLVSADDTGPQQLVKITGVAGQTIGEAVRAQHFGLTSNPPAGFEGVTLALGGGFDRAHVIDVDQPGKRPTGLASGAATVWDNFGNKSEYSAAGIKHTDKQGNIIESKSDRIYVKPGSGSIIVYLGGDGSTGTYAFVSTVSGPSINVKARIS